MPKSTLLVDRYPVTQTGIRKSQLPKGTAADLIDRLVPTTVSGVTEDFSFLGEVWGEKGGLRVCLHAPVDGLRLNLLTPRQTNQR